MGDEIRVTPTTYTVCGLPEDDPDGTVWTLSVEWTGQPWNDDPTDRVWAVRRMSKCLNTHNEWSYEPQPSSRDKAFYRTHRFTKDEAIRRAVEMYPSLVINGKRVEGGRLVSADGSADLHREVTT